MQINDDFRSIADGSRDELRLRAIRLLEDGNTQRKVAEIIGCHYNTVGQWWKSYQSEGVKSLKSKQRGRKDGEFRLLSPEQEQFIQKSIVDKLPEQLKLPFALWTRKAVQDLVYNKYKIKLAINTVGLYLNSWGFTPQKPRKSAYEQSPIAVQQWLDSEYPAIQEKAKQEKAEIHWGDETGVRNDHHYGRSYAPIGKTPVREHVAKRLTLNLISTVTNRGQVRFMTYEGTMTSQLLISFLKRLIRDTDKKILLILDNLRVHHSKILKTWLLTMRDKLEVFYLPPYSPDRNPDEYLNCDLKAGISQKKMPKNQKQLKQNVNSHMRLLQRNPERVIKYFKHESIRYAS